MHIPVYDRANLPALTKEQMVEVDRAMIEDFGIALIQMMENAGRGLALLARHRFLAGDATGKRVTVLAGAGGNGGGALVAARRLKAWGADVSLLLSDKPAGFSGVPARQLAAVRSMGLSPLDDPSQAPQASVILDGLIGYSLSGAPRGRAGDLIVWANGQSAPILALDAPSGLDTTTAQAFDPGIKATATLTLALPKIGFAHPRTGELYLADISVPAELYARCLGLEIGPVFAEADLVKLGSVETERRSMRVAPA